MIFFLALAIPTAVLIGQAYSQLKWEAFHHHRLQAEELVKRINKKYEALIEKENARSFTDYSFLNITGTDKSLRQSPLAQYPVNSAIPGTIGYFQVDNQGQFSTPLLPTQATSYSQSVTINNQADRSAIQKQLFAILKENSLVEKKIALKSQQPLRAKPAQRSRLTDSYQPGIVAGNAMPQAQDNEERIQLEWTSKKDARDSTFFDKAEEKPAAEIAEGSVNSQAAFDELQVKKSFSASEPKAYSKGLGRVEDIKLKRQYAEKERAQKEQKRKAFSKLKKRRVEQNILPAPVISELKRNQAGTTRADLRINMFESEIDPLEMSLLKSGQLVFYRKVWRDNQRYIQGFLVEPEKFISAIIKSAFYDTALSSASDLTIAYQGNIISAYSSKQTSRYLSSADELKGTLLLQSGLSSTLDQVELIFSVNQLPVGPGGQVINWLAVILVIILSGGFYLLYRLGVKQINLARQQQDFVSAVSHELKTPLTSIRMYGEMLREGWAPEEKQKEYYSFIYDESERLSRLINNVLQLARMTRNELKAELTPVTLSVLIDNLRSKVSSQAEREGFELKINCDEEVRNSKIEADEDYFAQVIINLVDNAIKFSSHAEKKQVDINCKLSSKNRVMISIRDYGPGIEKDQMRKIFQLFYRSENELTRETVGTGIGLSLVKQLVDSMQGEIDVINREPGVEFQLIFTPLN